MTYEQRHLHDKCNAKIDRLEDEVDELREELYDAEQRAESYLSEAGRLRAILSSLESEGDENAEA